MKSPEYTRCAAPTTETELLVVSFGTTFATTRVATIGAIEDAIEDAFPNLSVRRAFTSRIVARRLKERDGLCIDSEQEALSKAAASGVKRIVIQPTHLMPGFEYEKVAAAAREHAADFSSLAIGAPLLAEEEDYKKLALAIMGDTVDLLDDDTALILMGHGTEAGSNFVYEKLQNTFTVGGVKNAFIATVEATPSLEDVLVDLKQTNCSKVLLQPLMIVAGDHANNDMAGDEPDSWKNILKAEGFQVTCRLRGLGEIPAVRKMFVEHSRKAMNTL